MSKTTANEIFDLLITGHLPVGRSLRIVIDGDDPSTLFLQNAPGHSGTGLSPAFVHVPV